MGKGDACRAPQDFGDMLSDVSVDGVGSAPEFWDWTTRAVVPAVYTNVKYNQVRPARAL